MFSARTKVIFNHVVIVTHHLVEYNWVKNKTALRAAPVIRV